MTSATEPHAGPIVTRTQAMVAGTTRYFTGKPCKRGHISQRYSASSTCCWCSAIRVDDWATRNRKRATSVALLWQNANPDKRAASAAKWRRENRETMAALAAAYYQTHKEAIAKRHKERHQEAPEIMRAINRNRRARLRAAVGSHTEAEIRRLFVRQRAKCAYYRACQGDLRDGYHADHVTPLAAGGTNGISNIQLLCPSCNLRKHTADPVDFARRIGFLI